VPWQVAPAGDHALLVTLGTTIRPELLAAVLSLEQELTKRRPTGLLRTVGSYGSLLCHYDPAATTATRLADEIVALEGRVSATLPLSSIVDVPTRYDGSDLEQVAAATQLTREEVVSLHAGREYLVFCVGFAPGFTYCGELPVELAVGRRPSPRRTVPAGSVGIAGRQTGIYAVESPGGWNLIGRTALKLFEAGADPPARFKPGDRVRFVAE
jgi:inhibitor of KinA